MPLVTQAAPFALIETLSYLVFCSYEKRLLRYLEDLIKEMDRKILKAKDRAEKESAPRQIRPDDAMRLQEMQQRAKGTELMLLRHQFSLLGWEAIKAGERARSKLQCS